MSQYNVAEESVVKGRLSLWLFQGLFHQVIIALKAFLPWCLILIWEEKCINLSTHSVHQFFFTKHSGLGTVLSAGVITNKKGIDMELDLYRPYRLVAIYSLPDTIPRWVHMLVYNVRCVLQKSFIHSFIIHLFNQPDSQQFFSNYYDPSTLSLEYKDWKIPALAWLTI